MSQQATEDVTRPFVYTGDLVCSVSVSDLGKALDWYRDMLGFQLIYKLDEYGWAEIETPVTGFKIGLGQVEEISGQGAITPTFRVVDIDAARGHLEGNGVRFDGETHEVPGMVKLATFYDPDGNPWMLAQVLQEMGGE
ncbi:MAG TPA: VOC family protein [Gaiellaceae bacterium]|nr:VOC family protein [Gaiellaceae bacterium]